MVSIIVILLSFISNVTLFCLMFKGIYIPSWKMPIFVGIATLSLYWLAIWFMRERKNRYKTMFLTLSVTINIVYTISSVIYHELVSNESFFKVILTALLFFVLYLNFVYIRAEISYKRKRGNQRIQQEQEQSKFQEWRERRKAEKEGKEEEISIRLGYSKESKDQPPPI